MRRLFARMSVVALLGAVGLSRVASADVVAGPMPGVAEVAKAAEAQTPFKGFSFDITLQDSTGLNAVNYNNSLYMLFEPKWTFGKLLPGKTRFSGLTLAARFPLTYTMAGYDPAAVSPNSDHGLPQPCSNLTPSNNGTIDPTQVQRCDYKNSYRATPGDLSFTLSDPGIVKIPGADLRVNPAVRFTVPLSYESRYATMRFAVQGSLGVGRSFLGDKISVGYSFGATKYAYQYTAATIQTDGPQLSDGIVASGYNAANISAANASFYTDPGRAGSGASLNTDFSFSHVFTVGYNPTEKLSFSVLYVLNDAFAYDGACTPFTYGSGQTTDPCANANSVAQSSRGSTATGIAPGWTGGTAGRAHRDSQVFFLTASYQLKPWVGISAAWATFAPLRYTDNSYRQPFVSTNYDSFSSLNVGATFTLGATN